MKKIDNNKHTNPVTITTYIHQLKNDATAFQNDVIIT